jgi:uncharacterized protein (TIGR03437 family)
MTRALPALAVLFVGLARGAAPTYSAAGIVKAGSFGPGPFAPNSIVSIFGKELAMATVGVTAADIRDSHLPIELDGTRVQVDGGWAALFYVSDAQINFLMPANELKGPATVRVVRDGVAGPLVTVTIVDAAPALFATKDGYAIAAHGLDSTLITPDSPARAGEVIVIYAAGLGKTNPNPTNGEIPGYIAYLPDWKGTRVALNGVEVDSARLYYAGLTPASAGLYQVNVQLPDVLPANPELRIGIGDQASQGLKLAVK